jgi:hypothetical protein
MKSLLNGVLVIAVVLWFLNVFGLFHSLSRVHIGKGRPAEDRLGHFVTKHKTDSKQVRQISASRR